jgi:hypothetical protein
MMMGEMGDNGKSEIGSYPVKAQPYPDDAVVLALSVIQNGGSIRQACRAVGDQFGRQPDVHTVHSWAQRNAEAFAKLQPEKRREWETLAGRVFEAWANRALEAAEARDENGNYIVSHTQAMVPYGIAKDGLRTVLDAVNPRGAQAFNVQFNLVTRGEKPAPVIDGEVREAP